jgi:hypothetical protein
MTATLTRLRGFVPIVSLALLACAGSPAQPQPTGGAATASMGQPFEVAVGTPVTIADTGLEVRFHSVLEDSRCPAGVACVWAGRVRVALEVQAPNAAAEAFELSTCCPAEAGHHEYAGQSIDLVSIKPAPKGPQDAIGEADYRVEIVVTAT